MSIISLIEKFPTANPAQKGYFLYKNAPDCFLKKIADDNFKKTVQFVYDYSAFYRREFDKKHINPKKVLKPADLGDFFTTAEDIRQNPEEFICQKPDTAFETTGTTSKKPKRVYFSRNEVREAGWSGAVGLWALGVRPEDKVACAFDYSFWVSGPVLQASCEALGCFHVEAGRIPPEEFYDRVKDYGITVIVGDPSWLLGLSEVAKAKGSWPIKLMIGGGENMMESTRKYIEDVWKADMILSYGQTEAFGAIGMESLAKDGYHLNEFHNLFEIVGADSQGYGELVYTTLNRRVMPLLRYRSGDITRFLSNRNDPPKSVADPSCRFAAGGSGLRGQRIEKLKGRVDEWTATAMGNIAPWMFEPIFKGIDELGEDWQVTVDKDGNKDLIELHVEMKNGQADIGSVKNRILSNMKRDLYENYKIAETGGSFMRLDLKIHPQGTLRTGRKLKRIVDNRKF